MKKLSNVKWFTLGIVFTLILSVFVVPGLAANTSAQTTLTYNDIKITLDGDTITPKDASGNVVEPFIIDGTTYLPVRAVADALGLDVEWDAAAKTVKLNTQTDAPTTSDSAAAETGGEPSAASTAEVSEPEPEQEAVTTYVWIPTSGSKYHSKSTCSNMKNPSKVTLETAISRGYGKCSKCW